jgi:hypothetical protein
VADLLEEKAARRTLNERAADAIVQGSAGKPPPILDNAQTGIAL